MKIKTSAAFDGNTYEGARERLVAFAFYTLVALAVAAGGAFLTFETSYKAFGSWVILIVFVYLLANGLLFIPMVHSGVYGVAFIGHCLVALSTGLFVGPFLGQHSAELMEALLATGAVTVGMTCAGMLYPRFFAGLGRYLVAALFLFLFWMIGAMLLQGIFGITFSGHLISWVGIVLFSMFISHHVGMVASNDLDASEVIAESCGMFLSIVNLLLHVLGSRSDD